MRRSLVPLVAVCSVLLSPFLSAQAPGAQGVPPPGASVPGLPPPGVQRPGPSAPPRDSAQPAQPTGTGRLRGRVVASPAGTPLRRVQVTLTWSESSQYRRVQVTDAQGRYEFTELPAGRFSVSASKPGYVGLQYGQRRPYESGTSIVVNQGETLASIDFALPRGGVISGRISDEFGELMPQVQVSAQRFTYSSDGQRRLAGAGTATTDDRGEFRIYGLMPGEYVVQGSVRSTNVLFAGPPPNPNDFADGYPPTFYPGTPSAAAAQRISLGIGEEINVQFSLTSARLARITGTVRDSEGRAAYPAEVIMQPRAPMDIASVSSINYSMTGADGSFAFANVAPGEYLVHVRPMPTGREAAGEAGTVPVTITGSDIANVRITTSRGAVVSGRVIWEGTASRINPLPIGPPRVGATPAEQSGILAPGFGADPSADGAIADDGSFRLGGMAGRIFLSIPTPPSWTVRSVTLDGQDITDVPLDVTGRASIDDVRITLTDKLTSVAGSVSDSRGQAVTQYVVVLLPAEEKEPAVAARYMRTGRPDTNGRYEWRNIRPGRYVIAALESLEQGRQYAPEFQRELRRGAREFTVKEGDPPRSI